MSVFSSTQNSRRVLITASIVIAALVMDMMISSFIDVLGNFGSLTLRIVLFVVTYIVIYVGGQYLLLGFVKQVSRDLRSKKRDIDIMYRVVVIIQYVVSAILLVIILQIVLSVFHHYYSIYLIIAATTVSYIPASVIMGLLSYRFFSWYRSNKNAISLLFLIGTSMVAINVAVGVIIHSYYLLESHKGPPALRTGPSTSATDMAPQPQVNFPKITPKTSGIVSLVYLYAFFIPLNLAYLFAWAGCTVLLRYYSKILGNVRFWIIISMPVVIFSISIYPTLLALPNGSFTFYDPNLIFFRILFRLAGTAGGVFVFCVALLTISRSIRKVSQQQQQRDSVVADYMTISAYGVAMLAVSVQSPIIHTPYPPFGIAASSFVALASYLFSLGFYFSAISVSQDMTLRKSIRKYMIEESKLLDSIATAQMEQEIQNRVVKVAEENLDKMKEETGVEASLKEEDMREYLQEVLAEIHKANKNKDKDKE